MTELILHMNNYSITKAITAYQTYPYLSWDYLEILEPQSQLCNNTNWNKLKDKIVYEKDGLDAILLF